MLLCDEKITEDNRTLDFISTANYLDEMVVNPGRLSLISNFMNAHPPSYHRIICILHDKDFGVAFESIMPILFLSKRAARKFYRQTEQTVQKFHELATNKVKEEFDITDIRSIMEKTQQKEQKIEKIGKTYIFSNYATLKKIAGVLKEIKYVCIAV